MTSYFSIDFDHSILSTNNKSIEFNELQPFFILNNRNFFCQRVHKWPNESKCDDKQLFLKKVIEVRVRKVSKIKTYEIVLSTLFSELALFL